MKKRESAETLSNRQTWTSASLHTFTVMSARSPRCHYWNKALHWVFQAIRRTWRRNGRYIENLKGIKTWFGQREDLVGLFDASSKTVRPDACTGHKRSCAANARWNLRSRFWFSWSACHISLGTALSIVQLCKAVRKITAYVNKRIFDNNIIIFITSLLSREKWPWIWRAFFEKSKQSWFNCLGYAYTKMARHLFYDYVNCIKYWRPILILKIQNRAKHNRRLHSVGSKKNWMWQKIELSHSCSCRTKMILSSKFTMKWLTCL